jgi:dUTP pyrophosphatase
MQILKVKRFHPDVQLPDVAYQGDAGIDLYLPEDLELRPGERKKVGMGVGFEIPAGTVGLIRERSSKANDGMKMLGGVIDAGYRGEVFSVLMNTSSEHRYYPKGTAIAQLLVLPYLPVQIQESSELTPSERGARSFGSSDDRHRARS